MTISLKRALKNRLDDKQNSIMAKHGMMGDGTGVLEVTDLEHYVYVRTSAGIEEVFNNRVPPENDLMVMLGYDPTQPDLYQVLSTRTAAPGGVTGGAVAGYAPAIRYQWMADGGGQDPLWIDIRQFLPLRVGTYLGMLIQIYRGVVKSGSTWIDVNTQTMLLTSHVPTTAGNAAFVLITVDTTGDAIATKGAETTVELLSLADIPAAPTGTLVELAAVRVYNGQTAVQEARTNTDIKDLRRPYVMDSGSITISGGGTGGDTFVSWLNPWLYRRAVTLTNRSLSPIFDTAELVEFDTLELVEAGKINENLSDIRMTGADGTILLTFKRETDALVFNEANCTHYASNPVLSNGAVGTWDENWIQPDCIVQLDDGTYRIYYSGHNGDGQMHVGMATSPDGYAWTKYGSNPILTHGAGGAWNDYAVGHFIVRKEGATWKAWFEGWQLGGTIKIGYATSTDGITWTEYGSNPVISNGAGAAWDAGAAIPSGILKVGNTYMLYYWGGDLADQATWKIGLATSTDGTTWTKHASNPVLAGVGSTWEVGILEPFVEKIGSTYVMFYQGNQSPPDYNNSAIGIATSTDGVAWTKRSDNPLPRGAGGSWDEEWNEAPKLLKIGTSWLIYYMGSKGAGYTKQIGIYEFTATRLWPVVSIPASGSTNAFIYYGNPAASDVSTGSAGTEDANITVTVSGESKKTALWDDIDSPDEHAKDLYDTTPKYHTPLPTAAGKTIESVSDGGSGYKWQEATFPSSAGALNDLTDVSTSGEVTGDVLYKTAGDWQPYPLGLGSKVTVAGFKVRFGNVSGGNYLEIDTSTGNLRLLGSATAWDDIQPYYISGQGPSAAAEAQYGTTGFYWYKFTDNHGKDEERQFSFQIPHRMLTASDAHLHLHVVPSANGAAGNEDVVFRIAYQWVNIGGSYSTSTNTAFDTTFRVGAAEGNKHLIWEPAALSGAGKSLSSDLVVIVSRQSKTQSATDNYTGDIWLRYVDIHAEIDGFGSDAELVKDTTAAMLIEDNSYLLLESGDLLLTE